MNTSREREPEETAAHDAPVSFGSFSGSYEGGNSARRSVKRRKWEDWDPEVEQPKYRGKIRIKMSKTA